MPMYTFVCKRCGQKQDKRCAYAEVSKQTCGREFGLTTLDDQPGRQLQFKPCGGELEREGIEVTAKMGHQWSQI